MREYITYVTVTKINVDNNEETFQVREAVTSGQFTAAVPNLWASDRYRYHSLIE